MELNNLVKNNKKKIRVGKIQQYWIYLKFKIFMKKIKIN